MSLSISTIGIIIVAAIALVVILKILSGLLRLGIAAAIIGLVGYWIYSSFLIK